VRRGFFDAPKRKKKPGAAAGGKQGPGKGAAGMIEVKAPKHGAEAGEKAIPDFLRVDPAAQGGGGGGFPAHLEAEFKQKLTTAMKPTPDMMGKVLGDPGLMAGFDDPEVMRAVEEVSKNPAAMAKYQSNPKVANFYRAMAGMMASRCDELATPEGEGGRGEGEPAGGAPPRKPQPVAAEPSPVIIEELD
jgi:suppressor of tumorigenicity protein 13